MIDALDVNETNNTGQRNLVYFRAVGAAVSVNLRVVWLGKSWCALSHVNPSAVRIFVPLASTGHSVSRDAPAKMEVYVITSLENARVLLAGW